MGEVGRCFPWCEYMGNEFAIDSAGKNSKLFTTYGLGVPLGVISRCVSCILKGE